MPNEFIHKKFQKRAAQLEIIDNLYDDATFSEYYRRVINQDSLLENDIDLYKCYFDKETPILEIGSGTGRIFNTLFQEGYDVYGIEPSAEMSKFIDKNGQDRVYPLTLQDIEYLPTNNIQVIIIPATSVSLFSHAELENFLNTIKQQQVSIKRIVFDFLKEDFFINSTDIIQSHILDLGKFYDVNFFDESGEKIIYNLINAEKLGISVKYAYSYTAIQKIFEKLGIELNIITDSDRYIMIEGVFNGCS